MLARAPASCLRLWTLQLLPFCMLLQAIVVASLMKPAGFQPWVNKPDRSGAVLPEELSKQQHIVLQR